VSAVSLGTKNFTSSHGGFVYSKIKLVITFASFRRPSLDNFLGLDECFHSSRADRIHGCQSRQTRVQSVELIEAPTKHNKCMH
jgi:hypothetical protein